MDWNINMLQHPLRYRVDALPPNLKRRARDRIEEHLEWLEPLDSLTRATSGYKGVLNFMEHNDSTAYLPDFFKVNDLIDKVREESFFETFPELVEMKNYKLPQTMCMLPWVSIETSPVGSARPCCLAKDEIVDEAGNKYDMNQNTVTEIYNSKYMQDLRRSFRNGDKPATCTRCWEEEDAGRTSKRLHTLTRFKERYAEVDWENDKPNQLWFLDLKLGNICNLKCRICGSWSSSKWVPEEMDYVKAWGQDPKTHIAYQWLKQGNWPRNENSPRFWEDLKTILPQVKYFEFTGGEPFMIQEHFDLLQFAADNGYASSIDIHYNTNGTHFPEEFIETWKQFRKVEIAFSIDNVGERFEFERSGAKWAEVESNIGRFVELKKTWPSLSTQVCMTVNVQNVYYLEDLCNWVVAQKFDYDYFNMMHDPKHMNIGSMTAQAKELVIAKLESGTFTPKHRKEIDKIIQFIKNGTTLDNTQFLREMKRTDQYRGEDFAATHTEIAVAMGYDQPK
jgi:MoaA/NifB/PqqE/SkfB family radical SAM enzyme